MLRSTLLAAAVGCIAVSAAAQERTLRYAIQNPESHVSGQAALEFARVLEEETGGDVKVELYAGGQLGKVKEVTQNLQLGAIDMTIVRPGYLADLGAPEFNALSLPYIFSSDDHQDAVLFGPVGQRILDTLDPIKLKGIGFYRDLPRHFFSTDTAINSIEDMDGLKLRVQTSELAADTVSAVGAAPTPMAFSELYGALQSGVVDGGDQPITGFYAQRYQEVAKHIIMDGHDASPMVILMSKRTWDDLSEDQQAAVAKAHDAASAKFTEINDSTVGKLMDELTEAGVTIVPVEDKTPWQEATSGLIDKYGADFPDLIEEIRAADK